jgi:hypothetical protein
MEEFTFKLPDSSRLAYFVMHSSSPYNKPFKKKMCTYIYLSLISVSNNAVLVLGFEKLLWNNTVLIF